MQATLDTFEKQAVYDPCIWGGCLTCHARHHKEAGIVYCKEANYHGPPKDDRQCRTWRPRNPLIFWPPLPDNFVTPKKWRDEYEASD
jgi:hypothetical protein